MSNNLIKTFPYPCLICNPIPLPWLLGNVCSMNLRTLPSAIIWLSFILVYYCIIAIWDSFLGMQHHRPYLPLYDCISWWFLDDYENKIQVYILSLCCSKQLGSFVIIIWCLDYFWHENKGNGLWSLSNYPFWSNTATSSVINVFNCNNYIWLLYHYWRSLLLAYHKVCDYGVNLVILKCFRALCCGLSWLMWDFLVPWLIHYLNLILKKPLCISFMAFTWTITKNVDCP